MAYSTQKLPRSGPEREALREKGQFWTPAWVAKAMVAYALAAGASQIFDPAVGAGAFFEAARELSRHALREISLFGTEIDPSAIARARDSVTSETDLSHVEIREFVLDPPARTFDAIVANPPYLRHHRLPHEYKERLRAFGRGTIGRPLDGRTGFHVYFLLRALLLLRPNGRLAFIMPSDTCEGVFADALWNWITRNYRLEGVITFAPEATPFRGVDTNPIVFLIRNAKPTSDLKWARCLEPETHSLLEWTRSDLKSIPTDALSVLERNLSEALSTGLSRPPAPRRSNCPTLGDFARVMRGIATGANEFFFLTRETTQTLKLPKEYFVTAIGRTRDVDGDEVTSRTIAELEAKGRPTRLFSPPMLEFEMYPAPVKEYIALGENLGLSSRPLIASRKPWYKMESRQTPPILFAYLGRRSARFVRNYADLVPLTGFLCVFPRNEDPEFVEALWSVLRHPRTVENLHLVGKSYGSGAIKVEPRSLERLPIPGDLLSEVGLSRSSSHRQLSLGADQPFS